MKRASGEASTVRLVAPGLALIAVTYGLARFAYGLFLPGMKEAFDLGESALGLIGAGSYAGYCVAIVVSLVYTARLGARFMAVAAGAVAVAGMALIAAAPAAWVLAAGVLLAGSSTGLASPPMGEAVARVVASKEQGRANALINSGTSVGIALSGPVALVAAEQWRLAWTFFAAVGVVVLAWNAAAMPAGSRHSKTPPEEAFPQGAPALTFSRFRGPGALPLFVAAVGMGLASAAYWTFSRQLVVQADGLSPAGTTVFWVVVGVSGLAGGAAGDLIGRYGLGAVLRTSLAAMAVASVTLALVPWSPIAAYSSAALFGASYIMLTGVVLIWSVAVFEELPAAGIGAGFLMIAAGQAAGSPLAGMLAAVSGLEVTFFVFAGVAVATALVRPRRMGSGTSGNG